MLLTRDLMRDGIPFLKAVRERSRGLLIRFRQFSTMP